MRRTAVLSILALLTVSSSAWAQLSAREVMVGFPGEGMDTRLFRRGSWTPLAVELALQGDEPLQVKLRLAQFDRDGDVIYTQQDVVLTPNLEEPRTYWLYFLPSPEAAASTENLVLQVLDEDDSALEVQFDGVTDRKISMEGLRGALDADLARQHFLVLSITSEQATAGKIRELSEYSKLDESEYIRPLRVAHISPSKIPDHWHGLEMVDAIVWDVSGPVEVNAQQQRAIIDWVRHGGRLLIAAGGSAPELGKSEIGSILPVKIGDVDPHKALPELRKWKIAPGSHGMQPYGKLINVANCELREGSEAIVESAGKTKTYLARRLLDNGSVTFVAVTLKDLFSIEGNYRNFFESALQLRKYAYQRSPDERVRAMGYGGYSNIDLFEKLHEPINFQTQTTIYMLIAILFVLVYGLVATWGSWFALQSRKMLRHSWSVFALVAMAACLISIVGVQWIKGVGQKLHQVTIVDTMPGTYSASAHAYFGIKTSTYVEDLDIILPDAAARNDDIRRTCNYLRPLSPKISQGGKQYRFADTKRYEVRSDRAVVNDVPIRATLKQFEGYWRGLMHGQVEANISVERSPMLNNRWAIASGSTVTNQLGHDLYDCFLIEAQTDLDSSTVTRSSSMLVHAIGEIKNGEEIDLAERVFTLSGPGGTLDYQKFKDEHSLQKYHSDWVAGLSRSLPGMPGRFSGRPGTDIDDPQRAVLLLTTFSEYEPNPEDTGYLRQEVQLLQTHSRWLDRSAAINRHYFLLVGFCDDPGPVELRARRGRGDFRNLAPREPTTIYRVLIPVQRPQRET